MATGHPASDASVQLNTHCVMKALPVLDPRAAAIDVGSETLHVSIAGDTPEVFGTFTGELERLRDWFREQGVRSVAMEATGVYWLYVYEVLEAAGLEGGVVSGRHVRNVPGRKTDMADCQWLATLHAHGLLRGSFVPPAHIRQLQDYQRLRADHLIGAASQVQKMQQALERMNIKLHDVISDLVGVSGLKVVRAILKGERRPGELLALCDVQIQKKKADRVKESLRSSWKREHLFALGQALELWETYQQQIAACDHQIAARLQELTAPQPPEAGGNGNALAVGPVALASAKPAGKNAPVIEPTWPWHANWRCCSTGCCVTARTTWSKDSKTMKPKCSPSKRACCANWPGNKATRSSQQLQIKPIHGEGG